jgi:hypothetical protein
MCGRFLDCSQECLPLAHVRPTHLYPDFLTKRAPKSGRNQRVWPPLNDLSKPLQECPVIAQICPEGFHELQSGTFPYRSIFLPSQMTRCESGQSKTCRTP